MRWGILVVGLLACGPSVSETKAPSGERVFTVTCDGDGARCAAAARSKCSEGYGVDAESETTSGPHSMTFRCQRNTEPPAETSNERSTARVIGEAVADGLQAGAKAMQESQAGCYDSATCLSGQVCIIPKGQSRGFCATVR
jgi:hypothetical protein